MDAVGWWSECGGVLYSLINCCSYQHILLRGWPPWSYATCHGFES